MLMDPDARAEEPVRAEVHVPCHSCNDVLAAAPGHTEVAAFHKAALQAGLAEAAGAAVPHEPAVHAEAAGSAVPAEAAVLPHAAVPAEVAVLPHAAVPAEAVVFAEAVVPGQDAALFSTAEPAEALEVAVLDHCAGSDVSAGPAVPAYWLSAFASWPFLLQPLPELALQVR